jgi:hypothetical protein
VAESALVKTYGLATMSRVTVVGWREIRAPRGMPCAASADAITIAAMAAAPETFKTRRKVIRLSPNLVA